jgi:hypothetical protein
VELEFSPSECLVGPPGPYEPFVKESTWLDDTTLEVMVNVSRNCAESILEKAYEIQGSKIILKYWRTQYCICTTCMCPDELAYTFKSLERTEYEFELDEAVVKDYDCCYDSDCDDGDPDTTDTCENPGTPDAYCRHEGGSRPL